jgi:hypothetical protein
MGNEQRRIQHVECSGVDLSRSDVCYQEDTLSVKGEV